DVAGHDVRRDVRVEEAGDVLVLLHEYALRRTRRHVRHVRHRRAGGQTGAGLLTAKLHFLLNSTAWECWAGCSFLNSLEAGAEGSSSVWSFWRPGRCFSSPSSPTMRSSRGVFTPRQSPSSPAPSPVTARRWPGSSSAFSALPRCSFP